MKIYFNYYIKWFYRVSKENRTNPLMIIGLFVALFLVASYFFFERIPYPAYFYALAGTIAVYFLGTVDRNEFLKNLFTKKKYKLTRLIENLAVIFPFVLFLLFKAFFLEAAGLLIVAVCLSLYNKVSRHFVVIPTPFYKKPFEFLVGFRRTYWVFLLLYCLAIIAFFVDNFNLAMFSLLILFLACQNFYFRLEPHYYVWIHKQLPKAFIKNKLITALQHSLLVAAPIAIPLFVLYPLDAHWITLLFIIGLLYVSVGVVGKYAYYPQELNFLQQIIIAFGILLPPISVVLFAMFYSKSMKALQIYLK